MATPPLSLSNIVDISVTVSPAAAVAPTFNQGLFIGPSTVIPTYGSGTLRLRQYATPQAMLTDGFTTNEPEYIAAQIYFSQTPAPQFIWIGRQNGTALQTITINTAGTGWAVGDKFTVTQGGASYGTGTIVAETGGVPSSIAVVSGSQGTGYAVASDLATVAVSPSTGTGLFVNITVIGETLLQAATACRAASTVWYGLAVNNPADADNLALAEWADPLWQTTRYYLWSNDTAIPNAGASNLALQLQGLELRVLGLYSTTQSGVYPNNIYAAAGLMGVEMGLNTGLPGSFFTSAHKQIAGIAPEPLTQTQFTTIKTQGFNVYCNMAPYNVFEPAIMSNGDQAYLWLNLAMLVTNMQYYVMNVLSSMPAVPQTNSGEQLLLQAVNNACDVAVAIGFLAGGNWEGNSINLPGISLTAGRPSTLAT